MKELSIEEKAKAYDKAIKAAREWSETKNGYYTPKELCEEIFPELKENEDERIRKVLIGMFKGYNIQKVGDFTDKEIIAWLEKQGKNNMGISEATKQELEDNLNKALEKETPESLNKFLDGQGEQKPYGQRQECVDCQFNYVGECKGSCAMKRSEQKSNDTVEPKFKVGDWILYSGDHYEGARHITKIDENGYYIERNGLPHGIIPFNHEVCMRLWTIADAKDGDVLANDISVFIYAKVLYNKPYAYCGVDKFGVFKDNCLNNNWADSVDNIHPATKEQRNLLFKKMHEVGYEWNAEKKELGKIEQKLAWSEEDEYLLDETIKHLEALIRITKKRGSVYSDEIQYYQRDQDWLKSLKERIGGQIMKLIDKDAVVAEKSELKKLNGNKL